MHPSPPGPRAAARSWRFLLALLVAATPAAAQPAVGTVIGRVTLRADSADAPAPAVGAAVTLDGRAAASTGRDGRFVLARVAPGAHVLRVRLLGFRMAERALTLLAGDTAHVDLLLERDPQRLEAVRTDARSEEAVLFVARPAIATTTLSAAAMEGVPSVGEPDVVRVVQLLPGVVSRNDFNTGLNVRGGEADQNLVLLDGFPIYNPFHLGGLFSTFMDATVGGVELVTGAFPARFGGRLSSVLDVRSAVETRAGVHATADVSALGATARLAGASADGRGTWSIAGRRTYADAMTSLFTDNIFPYHFRDFQGRATWRTHGGLRLGLTGYLGRDVLDANLAEFSTDSAPTKASAGTWAFGWGNRVIGLALARDANGDARGALGRLLLGDSTTYEQRLSASGFSTSLDLGDGASTQSSAVRDLRASGSLTARGRAHDRQVGYEIATHRLRYASASPATGTTDFDFVQTPSTAALWAEDLWRVGSRVLVQGGVRAEGLTSRDYVSLSPRASVKLFATPDLAFTLGAGRVTQWLQSLAGDGPLRYFDIWIASDRYTPVATAWQYVAGAERRARRGSLRVEGYYKRYGRVMEANPSEDPQVRGDELLPATGSSYGVDALLRWHPARGPGGWISYTYGLSRRERDGVTWAPGHDRRHDLDVVATWPLARYRLGARFGFATGTPFTPIVGEIARRIYDPSRDAWGTGDPRIFVESLGGRRNSARFPPTQRLDLDVSRELRVRGATVSPYVSVANAYYAKNVFVYLYEYSTERPTRRAISQFPVLPSMGVRVAF